MQRRQFLKVVAGVISALPLSNLMADGKGAACAKKPAKEGLKILDPAGKTAKRLAYVEDASKASHTKFTAGSSCLNCKFYKAKKADCATGWAKCSMAGNKYVTSCGWCKSFKLNKKPKCS